MGGEITEKIILQPTLVKNQNHILKNCRLPPLYVRMHDCFRHGDSGYGNFFHLKEEFI